MARASSRRRQRWRQTTHNWCALILLLGRCRMAGSGHGQRRRRLSLRTSSRRRCRGWASQPVPAATAATLQQAMANV